MMRGYVIIAILIAWPLNTGMFFHNSQSHLNGYHRAEMMSREHLGIAIVQGAFFSIAWPVQVPIAFCMTGFAQHGVFSQREPPEHQREQ